MHSPRPTSNGSPASGSRAPQSLLLQALGSRAAAPQQRALGQGGTWQICAAARFVWEMREGADKTKIAHVVSLSLFTIGRESLIPRHILQFWCWSLCFRPSFVLYRGKNCALLAIILTRKAIGHLGRNRNRFGRGGEGREKDGVSITVLQAAAAAARSWCPEVLVAGSRRWRMRT